MLLISGFKINTKNRYNIAPSKIQTLFNISIIRRPSLCPKTPFEHSEPPLQITAYLPLLSQSTAFTCSKGSFGAMKGLLSHGQKAALGGAKHSFDKIRKPCSTHRSCRLWIY